MPPTHTQATTLVRPVLLVLRAKATWRGPVSRQNTDGGECTTTTTTTATPFPPAWAKPINWNLLARLNHASTHMPVSGRKTQNDTFESMAPTPEQRNTTKRAIGPWGTATAVRVAGVKTNGVVCVGRAGKGTNEAARGPGAKNAPTPTPTALCCVWGFCCWWWGRRS